MRIVKLQSIMRLSLLLPILIFCSCGNTEKNVIAATLVGGQAPANEIQQIYYLGVFDPQEQVQPTIYRVRVHGQASAISTKRFASGWVPANLVDSLSTGMTFNGDNGSIEITGQESSALSSLSDGRKLMLFGPEGFREAPSEHRLVIMMGSNPEAFFGAINKSINTINQQIVSQRSAGLEQMLLTALLNIRDEKNDLEALKRSLSVESAQGAES